MKKCLLKNRLLILLIAVILIHSPAMVFAQKNKLDVIPFHSSIFPSPRFLRILLPPGYNDPSNLHKKYPVLYLNDGQNLFDSATSYFTKMEWRIDETLDSLYQKDLLKKIIVVGIDNGGRRERGNEYLPYEDIYLTPKLTNPHGNQYPDFLVKEVVPFIDARYRTIRSSKGRSLGGSSYGALIALYAAIKKPGQFNALLIESPSLYVSDKKILSEIKQSFTLPSKIYLGVGTNEGGAKECIPGNRTNEATADVIELHTMLKQKKYTNRNLHMIIEECARHNEKALAERFPYAILFLFGK